MESNIVKRGTVARIVWWNCVTFQDLSASVLVSRVCLAHHKGVPKMQFQCDATFLFTSATDLNINCMRRYRTDTDVDSV